MVTSSVSMIADSISPEGIRLCTMHLRYWRPIHSELMTHRVFSRNARSSRAVPVATLLSEEMFVPEFGMNQKGMQASEDPVDPDLLKEWVWEWNELAQITRRFVKRWGERGMHKQWANRPLEWFGWIDVLVTSTDWENFFALRLDSAAQPELRILAEQMSDAMRNSQPDLLQPGEWHLPYITAEERSSQDLGWLKMSSTARCARLSYEPFDGNADFESEMKRYERLVVSRPVHASPAEHQATPDRGMQGVMPPYDYLWERPQLHGNFHGWIQHRKTLANEQVKDHHR